MRRSRVRGAASLVTMAVVLLALNVWAAPKQVLTAKYVRAAPTGLDDGVWREVPDLEVPNEGKEKFVGK